MSEAITTLEQLAIEHPYYSSGKNFYSNDAGMKYETWADFYEEFHDADVDMNLVYRWDIDKRENSGRYYMYLFMIHQRKGIYAPIDISYVDDADVETIIKYLKPHMEKLKELWLPLKFASNNNLESIKQCIYELKNTCDSLEHAYLVLDDVLKKVESLED